MSKANVSLKNKKIQTSIIFLLVSITVFIAKIIIEIISGTNSTNMLTSIAYIIAALSLIIMVIKSFQRKNHIFIIVSSVILISIYIYYFIRNLTGGFSNFLPWAIFYAYCFIVYVINTIIAFKKPQKASVISILLTIIAIISVLNGVLLLVDMITWSHGTLDMLYYLTNSLCYPLFDIAYALIIPQVIIVPPTTIADELFALKKLYDNGQISEIEYNQKKTKILNKI